MTEKHKSWVPGSKGQGGEGFSHGYGGSSGEGTGSSGPETSPSKRPKPRSAVPKRSQSKPDVKREGESSLPSRERLAQVLR